MCFLLVVLSSWGAVHALSLWPSNSNTNNTQKKTQSMRRNLILAAVLLSLLVFGVLVSDWEELAVEQEEQQHSRHRLAGNGAPLAVCVLHSDSASTAELQAHLQLWSSTHPSLVSRQTCALGVCVLCWLLDSARVLVACVRLCASIADYMACLARVMQE